MNSSDRPRPWLWSLAAMIVSMVACSETTTGPDPIDQCAGKDALGSCLPTWSEFSPLQASMAPTEDPSATQVSEVTEELERFDEQTGALVTLGSATFVCTDKTYSFTDNPSQALSFRLDETVIYPGALIQGLSHREGNSIGSVLELPIRERAPINVTLTFNNQDNTRLVNTPDNSSIAEALGSMIGNAEAEGLATANNIDFKQETYSSEQQAALSFGVSGRYLGFEASATGSRTTSVSTNVVAAQFKQQMYVAGVTQPSTPAAFFSDAFTDAAYQSQAQLGRIGPANPPLYVSRVGYGRMMVFTMTAKAEAEEIQGALDVAYRFVGGDVQAELTAKQSSILSSAEIRISQVGGNQQSALAAISTGRLADYFTDTAELTSAAPLWFELKTLTGEVAHVSEPGTYTETTCVPKLPGTFEYEDEQNLSIPFTPGTQRTTLQADVNGDGMMDLVFNERRTAPALNRTHVAVAGGAGGFTLLSPWDHGAEPAEGWENFDVLVGDFDGDGNSDIAWNTRGATNVVYLATSMGDGSYTEGARQQHVNGGWGDYRVLAGDISGDGRDDLVWTNAGAPGSSSVLRTYFGLSRTDGTLSMNSNFVDRGGDYRGYRAVHLAQMDGAGGLDVVYNAPTATGNAIYVGRFTATSDSTGTLSFPGAFYDPVNGWDGYSSNVGNIDGTSGGDLVWINGLGGIHRTLNTGNGTFLPKRSYVSPKLTSQNHFLADFNNDGRDDVLLVRLTADTNQLITGFGLEDGDFTFPAGVQTHPGVPTVGWEPFDDIFVGDVNGDGKADIVWTNPSGDAQIYVALAK